MATSIVEHTHERTTATPVAAQLQPVLEALLGAPVPIRFQCWDGSAVGPDSGPTIRIEHPDALKRIVWAPGELGLVRSFVAGQMTVDGDLIEALALLDRKVPRNASSLRLAPSAIATARRLGVFHRPPAPPSVEFHPSGWRSHTLRRDAEAIAHHYDVSNDFYRMVLGPSMTYSCARFESPTADLTTAQASKHEHICRKLGLDADPGARLLDVGCGWGSMAIHAASHHGVKVVGITISTEQAAAARQRVEEAGVSDLVEIRLQDYRELGDEQFDAISSIGMSEHVGKSHLAEYFSILHRALRPQGRLLNHAISHVGGSKMGRHNSFIQRYVFPDGELIDVGDSVLAMEEAGFEIRDVESLREHYALTLRQWVRNLEGNWDAAVAEVGPERARVWRLYMSACVITFERARTAIHQVLGVVSNPTGASGMPLTRPA